MGRKMKNSGVEWIGEIPLNWQVRKIKDLYEMQTGFTPDTKNEDYYADETEGYEWLTIGDMNGSKYIPNTTKNYISSAYIQQFKPPIREAECDGGKSIFNRGTGFAAGGYHFCYLLEISCRICRRDNGSDYRYHEVGSLV